MYKNKTQVGASSSRIALNSSVSSKNLAIFSKKTNYEQSESDWISDCKEAGFSDVRSKKIFDYWWSPLFILEASK